MSFHKNGRWRFAICRLLMALLVAVCLLPGRAAPGDATGLEYKVKAGYLFNFAKLVEWPQSAFPAADSPMLVDVLGGGEVLDVMRQALEGQVVNGHPLRVRSVSPESINREAHILFMSREFDKSAGQVQAALAGSATLLVGETEGFAKRGGCINFLKSDGRVKFEVNPGAANRAGLKLGSQMMKLAIVVKDSGPGEKN
jgi:YfiR/HmsC-like